VTIAANTYYIDATLGADTNAGSASTPLQTLAKISSLGLMPDDIVYLKRGKHTQDLGDTDQWYFWTSYIHQSLWIIGGCKASY